MAGYFFVFLREDAGLDTGFSALALGASPITSLSGQILKAGHFWQPATTAMGQSVMGIPVERLKRECPVCAGSMP